MVLDSFTMRTISKRTNRCVTIMAQDTETHGEAMPFKPSVEFCPTIDFDKSSMLHPTSVNMVNAKKFCVGFTTASTFIAIIIKNFLFDFCLASLVISKYPFSIKPIMKMPLSQIVFSMCLTPYTGTSCTYFLMGFPVSSLGFCSSTLILWCHISPLNLLYHKAQESKTMWDGKTIFPQKE